MGLVSIVLQYSFLLRFIVGIYLFFVYFYLQQFLYPTTLQFYSTVPPQPHTNKKQNQFQSMKCRFSYEVGQIVTQSHQFIDFGQQTQFLLHLYIVSKGFNSNACQLQIIMKLTSKQQSYYFPAKENRTFNLNQQPHFCQPKQRARAFNSPQTHTTYDYNSFMAQKKHAKVEYASPTRSNLSTVLSPTHRPLPPHQPYQYEVLLRQNNYLIQELLKSKDKEIRYRNKIRQLKKEKADRNCNQTYISIEDLSESKWRGQSVNTISSICADKISTQDSSKVLLDSSMEFIRHASTSLATDIDIVNDRLCRLLEEASCEQDRQKKLMKRREMCQCVEELKQLRKFYEDMNL